MINTKEGQFAEHSWDYWCVLFPSFVRNGIYSFRSPKEGAKAPGSAVLFAQDCASKEISEASWPYVRGYLAEHVESWYDQQSYPKGQHENLSTGSLSLIYASYKSKTWAAAALPRSSMKRGEQSSVKLLRTSKNPDLYDWDADTPFIHTCGSSNPRLKKITYTVAVEAFSLLKPVDAKRNVFQSLVQISTGQFLQGRVPSIFSARWSHRLLPSLVSYILCVPFMIL